jgi:hypothetical protein
MSQRLRRRHACTLALSALLAALLVPAPAFAACGVQDPAGCVDGALYQFWYGLAGMGWALDRTLLLLAYQLDTFRWWLVEVAFASAYQVLIQVIDPLILPFVVLAVTVACFAVLLLPLFGRSSLANVRHALVWAVLAPLILSVSGPLVVQLERLRADVGTTLFAGVSQIAPGAIFGAGGSDMSIPAPLYPSNPCGGETLTRRSAGGLRPDDLAAALLWADAEDIHCPDRGGPSADIPDLFFDAAPSGPGYARDENVAEMQIGNIRAQAVISMQRGAVRTFLGLLPSLLAVLDALVQLVFALCLVALWVSLPIGLLFVGFTDTAGAVTGLWRRFLAVLQVSWSSSVLLGIVAACLIAAAELRNAAAYTGFAIGGLVLTAYLLLVAVDTFRGCVRTLNDTVASVTGLSVTRPVDLARDGAAAVVGTAAAVAAGGIAAGATAGAALAQTGSGRYAAAAVLGRIRPVAQLGEVAAAMGYLQDDETLAGLHVGQRSVHGGWRGMRLQMATDATRTDDAGLTFREQAQARALEREITRAQQPTVVQEIGDGVRAGRAALAYVGSAQLADDLAHVGDRIPQLARAGQVRVQRSWATFQDDVTERSNGSEHLMRRGIAAAQVLDDRLRPGERGKVMRLDTRQRLQYDDPSVDPPAHALRERAHDVQVPQLLLLGYAVQPHDDGTVSFWQRDDRPASTSNAAQRRRERSVTSTPTPVDPATAPRAEERARLVAHGIIGKGAAGARRAPTVHATTPASPPPVRPATAHAALDGAPHGAATRVEHVTRSPLTQLQAAHAALVAQRQALGQTSVPPAADADSSTHPAHDPEYQRLKLALREQELIADALGDPVLATPVAEQIQHVAAVARETVLTRAAVQEAAALAELPPATDRTTWRAQHQAQRRFARVERERQAAQRAVAQQRHAQTPGMPRFSPAALHAVAGDQRRDSATSDALIAAAAAAGSREHTS